MDIALYLSIHQLMKCDEKIADYLDLRCADLSYSNLHGANLRGANLRGADLYHADLQGADLQGANLRDADLQGANLIRADLHGANLRGANLRGANLRGANLRGADLYHADLQGANLKDANLKDANLQDADLQGADLSYANLSHVILDDLPVPITDLSAFKLWDNDPEWIVGYRTKVQPYMYGPEYEVEQEYRAPYFLADPIVECGPGLYLCPELQDVQRLPAVKVIALKRETMRAGGKYRCKRFYVVDEIK